MDVVALARAPHHEERPVAELEVMTRSIALPPRLDDEAAARAVLAATGKAHGLACVDPIRTGVAPLVDALEQRFPV